MDGQFYVLFYLFFSSMKFKDPAEGEVKLKTEFDELYENMQAAFRQLEE